LSFLPTCFVHVLSNALDMHEKGKDVKAVLEGEAVTVVQPMIESKKTSVCKKAVNLKLIDCICKGCSTN